MLSAWCSMLTIYGLNASHLTFASAGREVTASERGSQIAFVSSHSYLGSTSSVLTWVKSQNGVEHLWDPTGSQLSLSFPF